MTGLLHDMLVVSVTGGGILLIMLVVRGLWGRLTGAWWRPLIWAMILIRMCIPFTPAAPFSIYGLPALTERMAVEPTDYSETNGTGDANVYIGQQAMALTPDSEWVETGEPSPQAAGTASDSSPDTPPSAGGWRWIAVIPWIYGVGLALSAVLLATRMVLLIISLSRMKPVDDERIRMLLDRVREQLGIRRYVSLVISRSQRVPSTAGVLKPRIILPAAFVSSMSDSQLELVLLHELNHLRRGDILLLWLSEIAACIHWFNPVVHIMKHIIRQDIELACDESLIKGLESHQIADYGQMLAWSACPRLRRLHGVAAPMSSRAGRHLKQRLYMMARFGHRRTRAGIALLAAAVVLMAACTTLPGTGDGDAVTPQIVNAKAMRWTDGDTPDAERILSQSEAAAIAKILENAALVEPTGERGVPVGCIRLEIAAPENPEFPQSDYNIYITKDYDDWRCVATIDGVEKEWGLENADGLTALARSIMESGGWIEETEKPASASLTPTPTPVLSGDGETLLSEPPDDIISIGLSPTEMGVRRWYYVPDDTVQRQLEAMLQGINADDAAQMEVTTPLGVTVVYNGVEWELVGDGSLYDQGPRYRIAGYGDLCELVWGLVQEQFAITSFSPADISGIVRAEMLYYEEGTAQGVTARQVVTDPDKLAHLNDRLSNAVPIIGGTGCPFWGLLTLTRSDGETIVIRMAADSCQVYTHDGLYFSYDPDQSGSDEKSGTNEDVLEIFDEIPWR